MNHDFFEALDKLVQEKRIPADKLIVHIKSAISVAMRKYYNLGEDNLLVEIDPEQNKFQVSIIKHIVETVEDESTEVSLAEALEQDRRATLGGVTTTILDTKQIGRIAALSGKNLIHQAINDVIKEQLYEQYQSKIHQVVLAVVQKIEPRTGNVTVRIGKTDTVLFENEQIPGETFTEGQIIKVYVSDVLLTERRTTIKVSRAHREMVRRLFEAEVPEIADGIVEIKSISREAGSRSKIAVWSLDDEVDPRGACIGQGGTRVAQIVKELQGEKVDVVLYDEDPATFVAHALAPAEVCQVLIVDPNDRVCRVSVPDHQLSLAIGNRGQNAKLAARLTGYKIDIKAESVFEEDLPEIIPLREEGEDFDEGMWSDQQTGSSGDESPAIALQEGEALEAEEVALVESEQESNRDDSFALEAGLSEAQAETEAAALDTANVAETRPVESDDQNG